MNQIRTQTSQVYFTSLKILHIALLIGQILFAGVSYFLHQSGGLQFNMGELAPMLKILVPILILGASLGSQFLFKFKIREAISKESLSAKLVGYRIALVLQCAILEGASLFSIMSYLLTADIWFLAMAAIVIVVFVLQAPNQQKVAMVLQLNNQEKQILEKPDNVVIE